MSPPTAAKRRRRRFHRRSMPISHIQPRDSRTFDVADSSVLSLPGSMLVQGDTPREPHPQEARLVQQFLTMNRGIMRDFGIAAELRYDGNEVRLQLQTTTKVGALPLLSPTTGRPDYGLVIHPRFGWQGIGPMLGMMGWRIVPNLLGLPLLPTSDRKIPAWVLSTVILSRIKALLDRLDRRFEFVEDDQPAPKGSVNWAEYVTGRLSSGRFLEVPCRFPDLRDDQEIKAAIHFTLRKQLASLESQRVAGMVVLQLIDLCQALLSRVRGVPPREPSPMAFSVWQSRTLSTEVFRTGLQAIEWTVDDRGLAGLGDLQGLPWIMSMEEFFEAWVETILSDFARKHGWTLKAGRRRETVVPLSWEPPYLGSQKYLLPDLVLERDDEAIVVDAKYKSHWEEINFDRWASLDEMIREHHRADLLQVMAYAGLTGARRTTAILVYPCQEETWKALMEKGHGYYHANVPLDKGTLTVVLTATPMGDTLSSDLLSLNQLIRAVGDDVWPRDIGNFGGAEVVR